MDTRVLGERVRVLREQRGWTLREFARQVGLSASYLSRLEDGFTQPRIVDLQAVAKGLSVSLTELADLAPDNSDEMSKKLNAAPRLKQHVEAIAEGYQWCDSNQRAIVDSLLSAIVRVVTPNGQSKDQNGSQINLTERQGRTIANNREYISVSLGV